jgi:polyisoprenoid-binding protein YceI
MADAPRPFLRRRSTWLVGIPIVVVLALVAGPFIYINFIQEDAPDRLTLTDRTSDEDVAASDPSTGDSGIGGTWQVADGSIAGYRVKEVLFGQDTEAAGRTSDVAGSLAIDGTTVNASTFTVDMTTITSDESRRDGQFHGRIMSTSQFPTATFELEKPIQLANLPGDGEQITVEASGEFAIHGVTNPVTFPVVAQRNGAEIEINGTIPVTFDDYDIPEPSFGPATVEDHGEIEFLLIFARA